MLYQFCKNDPVNHFDIDGRDFKVPGPVKQWYKLQAGVGVAVLIADSCILYMACKSLNVGEETFVRTPGTRILTIPLLPAITLLCPEGGVLYYRVWKPSTAGCDNELVVFCFGSGGGA
jgi:hypothetical protein